MKSRLLKVCLFFIVAMAVTVSKYQPLALGQSGMADDWLEVNSNGEANDLFSEATEIAPGFYDSLLCLDTDWYRFNLSKNKALLITLLFSNSANGNIDLIIYRKDDSNSSWSPDSNNWLSYSYSQDDNEEIFIQAQAGTYYCKVFSSTPEKNNRYALKVEAFDYNPVPCSYLWLDPPSPIDNKLAQITLDDGYQEIFIGFPFFFFGVQVASLKVSSNGYITFGNDSAVEFYNRSLDTQSSILPMPSYIIAPFWDDLNPQSAGKIYAWLDENSSPRRFVVQWNSIPHASSVGSNSAISFEVWLYEGTNEIVFQYKDIVFDSAGDEISYGRSATVGLRHKYQNQVAARQFSYNQAFLSDGLAISFSPVDIEVSPCVIEYSPLVQDQNLPSVDREALITISFSQAMNTVLTEGAFSIQPFISGQFIWENDQKDLKFAPDNLLAASTKYTIQISQGAKNPEGLSIASPFQFTFTTLAEPVQPPQDETPPYPDEIIPTPDAMMVSPETPVLLELKDDGEGIDPNSILLMVEGIDVTALAQVTLVDEDSHHIRIEYKPSVSFSFGQVVDVSIHAQDLATPPNLMTPSYSYYFTIIDMPGIPPYVADNPFPVPDSDNVSINTAIELHIINQWLGVDPNSVSLYINGEKVTPLIQSFDVYFDYFITYQPQTSFGYNQEVLVRVEASDRDNPPNFMEPYVYEFITQSAPVGEIDNFPVDHPVTVLVYGMQENLWLGTAGGGLVEFDLRLESLKANYLSEDGLSSNNITCLAMDHEGFLWIGTVPYQGQPGGLIKFDSIGREVVEIYNTGLGNFPDDYINDVEIDGNNVVWVATHNKGVVRLADGNYEIYAGSQNGLSEDWVKEIALSDQEIWWIGGSYQIYKVDESQTINELANLPLSVGVEAFFCDEEKNLLIATRGGGIYGYYQDGTPFSHEEDGTPLPYINSDLYPDLTSDNIKAVFIANQCNIYRYWLATDLGVTAASGDLSLWQAFTIDNSPLASSQINCIVEDGSGQLWFGTDQGLSKIDLAGPYVTDFEPKGSDIDLATVVQIYFSEPMDRDSVIVNVSPSFNYTNAWNEGDNWHKAATVLTLIPTSPLGLATAYTVTIGRQASDRDGNYICSSSIVSFAFSTLTDATSPQVFISLDSDGPNNVPISSKIYLEFSEPMQPPSVENAILFYQSESEEDVSYTLSQNEEGTLWVISPEEDLAYNTSYVIEVLSSPMDLAGNSLVSSTSLGFRTNKKPQPAAPPQPKPSGGGSFNQYFPYTFNTFNFNTFGNWNIYSGLSNWGGTNSLQNLSTFNTSHANTWSNWSNLSNWNNWNQGFQFNYSSAFSNNFMPLSNWSNYMTTLNTSYLSFNNNFNNLMNYNYLNSWGKIY